MEEKILIKYWTENCFKYSLRDGRKIRSAQHSIPFDSYPDIQKNELDDGTIVPAEVEWNTSNFDRHGHDISVLIDHKGFLIVLEKVNIPLAEFCKCPLELACSNKIPIDPLMSGKVEPLP